MVSLQHTIRMLLLAGACSFAFANWAAAAPQEVEDSGYSNETIENDSKPSWDASKLPEVAQDIGIDTKTGEFLTLDTSFTDETNNLARLKFYFDGKHPVLLSFNYSNCPKLCSVQLENMISCLRQVDLDVGKDFQMVSISIDPLEQASRAKQTKDKFTKQYNRPGTEDGFHFLVGDRDAISFAAEECGFRYKYVPHQKLYSHLPCFILVSPKGKIVRYIHGLDYKPETMKMALVEASEGRIGSPINRLSYSLGCYLFDESSGKYTMQAMVLMRLGGAVTVILLLITLIPYWFFRKGLKSGDKLPSEELVHPSTL